MQMDPTTGEVYFIEIDAENFNAQTGEITVTFPVHGTVHGSGDGSCQRRSG